MLWSQLELPVLFVLPHPVPSPVPFTYPHCTARAASASSVGFARHRGGLRAHFLLCSSIISPPFFLSSALSHLTIPCFCFFSGFICSSSPNKQIQMVFAYFLHVVGFCPQNRRRYSKHIQHDVFKLLGYYGCSSRTKSSRFLKISNSCQMRK